MTGLELQKAKDSLGWTQLQLADRLGVTRRTLQRWLSDGAPPMVGLAVRMLLLLETASSPSRKPEELESRIALVLDSLVAAGWTAEQIQQAVGAWRRRLEAR